MMKDTVRYKKMVIHQHKNIWCNNQSGYGRIDVSVIQITEYQRKKEKNYETKKKEGYPGIDFKFYLDDADILCTGCEFGWVCYTCI